MCSSDLALESIPSEVAFTGLVAVVLDGMDFNVNVVGNVNKKLWVEFAGHGGGFKTQN